MSILSKMPLTKIAAQKYGKSEMEIQLILKTAYDGATDSEVAMLLYQAARTGLDPLARQIYLVGRYDTRQKKNVGSIQTGIDGYRLIADRTGQYVGSSDPIFDEGLTQYQFKQTGRKNPTTATITVKKLVGSTVIGEFTATAEWDSYYPGDAQGFMWRKMPLVMLSKVSEALALRKAFPAQLSGIYTSEEMMQAGEAHGDIAVEEMVKDMGYQNPNSISVIDKLSAIGISESDPAIEKLLGMKISDVPNTNDGNELLAKLWKATVMVHNKKSPNLETAFSELTHV